MPHVSRSALVPYAAARMYALVNDVNAYPEFLPWCSAARILEAGDDYMVAELAIERGGVAQRFTTRNQLVADQQITLELVEGPFEHFVGRWQFIALAEDACKVALELDFDYAGRLMRKMLGPVFNRSADTLVDAFCARARALHDA